MLVANRMSVLVNSRNRSTGTNSKFTFKLPRSLADSEGKYQYVCLLSASIPKSYYLVESGENTFTLRENATDYTVTIPPGNYTRKSLQSTLQTQLNAMGAWTYTVTIPTVSVQADTGKYTITVTGNGGLTASLIFTDYLYEPLGFNANSTNTFTSTLESTNVIKVQKEDVIVVHSDVCKNNDIGDDIMAVIYADTDAPYGSIKYNVTNLEAYSKEIRDSSTNTISVTITNEDNNEMDLQGQNCVLLLLFWNPITFYAKVTGFINYLIARIFENNGPNENTQ